MMKEWKKNPEKDINEIRDIENILSCVIKPLVYKKVVDLDVSYASSKEPVPWNERLSLSYKAIKENEVWSEEVFGCAWFHLTGKLDPSISRDNLYLSFDCNGEALLYSKDGTPLKGFTNGSSCFDRNLAEPRKLHYEAKDIIANDGTIDLYIDAGSNDLFGNLADDGKFLYARIDRKDDEAERAYFDVETLTDFLKCLSPSSPYYASFLDGLTKIRDLFWYKRKNACLEARAIASSLFNLKGSDSYSASLIGHAHIDLAWLWPLRESKRKALRTITNVFYLLERYPNFVYAISQPVQIEWIKEASFPLFEKLVNYEKEGRIELVGGGYVESDTNCIGEESMARQMLYGQRFYKENFGHYASVGWLPDSFGYSASFPLVLSLSEQPYFVTTKIGWNTVNEFPFHNFIWEGLGGAKVLAHLPPEGTYNSGAYPRSLIKMEKNTSKDDGPSMGLMLYGIGDGGGGPSTSHLEHISRMERCDYLPRIKCEKALSFFKKLEAHEDELNTYTGELYLENHQGTYTSASRNKVSNRYFEEKFKVMDELFKDKDSSMDSFWKGILLYQFHDILPGSSINRVYDESDEFYSSLDNESDAEIKKALPSFIKHYEEGSYIYNQGEEEESLWFFKGEEAFNVLALPHEFTCSYHVYKRETLKHLEPIDNGLYVIFFASDGHISSIKDIEGHEYLKEGNRLRVYIDHGDAWNILPNYRNQDEVYMDLLSQRVDTYGPLTRIKNSYGFLDSRVEETIEIEKNNPVIKFFHTVNWKNTGYMLHSCFLVDDYSDFNHFDIQYGSLIRSSRNETSIEKAQFEVPSYKWADVSSSSHGISFINNARNGCYAKGGAFELNLLRSTNYPAKDSDQKETHYSYAIYPHKEFKEIETDIKANAFNAYYLISKEKPGFTPIYSSNPDIAISTVKRSYLKEGSLIRLYERSGVEGVTSLNIKGKAFYTDLLEEVIEEADPSSITLKPHEVKSIWIK